MGTKGTKHWIGYDLWAGNYDHGVKPGACAILEPEGRAVVARLIQVLTGASRTHGSRKGRAVHEPRVQVGFSSEWLLYSKGYLCFIMYWFRECK